MRFDGGAETMTRAAFDLTLSDIAFYSVAISFAYGL